MTAIPAVALLAAALAFHFAKRVPRAVAILALLAGAGFGFAIAGWLATLLPPTVTGTAIGLGLSIFGTITWIFHVHPKGGKPKRWITPITGFLLPALIITSVGGPLGATLNRGVCTANAVTTRAVNQVARTPTQGTTTSSCTTGTTSHHTSTRR